MVPSGFWGAGLEPTPAWWGPSGWATVQTPSFISVRGEGPLGEAEGTCRCHHLPSLPGAEASLPAFLGETPGDLPPCRAGGTG